MRRRAFLATVGTAAVAGCLGLGAPGGPTCGGDCHVGMAKDAFQPDVIEVTVGEEVVWRNTSSAAHTVTALDGQLPDGAAYFASGGYETQTAAEDAWHDGGLGGRLVTGDRFRHTFEVVGTYEYYCIPHVRAGMYGEVVVSEG